MKYNLFLRKSIICPDRLVIFQYDESGQEEIRCFPILNVRCINYIDLLKRLESSRTKGLKIDKFYLLLLKSMELINYNKHPTIQKIEGKKIFNLIGDQDYYNYKIYIELE